VLRAEAHHRAPKTIVNSHQNSHKWAQIKDEIGIRKGTAQRAVAGVQRRPERVITVGVEDRS
jgi:hypothetical protein